MRGLLLIGILSMALVACNSSQSHDALAYAESSISSGNYAAAQKTCDSLLQVQDDFYATQWCRLSIAYMKLADKDAAKSEENTAVATRCYTKAIEVNRDSANAYYEALPTEDYPHYDMLAKLANPVRDVNGEDFSGDSCIENSQHE